MVPFTNASKQNTGEATFALIVLPVRKQKLPVRKDVRFMGAIAMQERGEHKPLPAILPSKTVK